MEQSARGTSNDLILRLFKVARGMEDEGQNNIAKIFRAAALGEIYRAEQDRPRQGAGLEEEMRDLVGKLSSQSTTSESLKSAMAHALQTFENGEWPMLSDIPEPFVCRFCGEVMIGDPPDQCPACRSRRYTFQEIPPIFYLDPLSAREVEVILEANLADVELSVDGVDEAAADRGVWPMRDILSHIAAAQELMFGRAKRMNNEEIPNLGSIPPTEIRVNGGSEPQTMREMLRDYVDTRREVIQWFSERSDEELSRTGMHPEWGRLTILSQITYMVRHEQSHLAELQDRREGR